MTGEIFSHSHDAPERDPEHDAAVPAVPDADPPAGQMPPAEMAQGPLTAGTYAIYADGAGGLLLVLDPTTGETFRHHISAALIKTMDRAAKYTGMKLPSLAGLFGAG